MFDVDIMEFLVDIFVVLIDILIFFEFFCCFCFIWIFIWFIFGFVFKLIDGESNVFVYFELDDICIEIYYDSIGSFSFYELFDIIYCLVYV